MRYLGKVDHLILFSTMFFVQLVNSDTILQTESGPVQGKMVSSGKVEAFLGIPYAEPPVGPLRFAKPLAKTPWKEVLDATHLPPPCIQLDLGQSAFGLDLTVMSEDCLFLNVWVPRSKTADELKPIMFFVHGGGFFMGSASMNLLDGAKMAEYGDVVVVTINYRLGALGFFTDFSDESPGSLGLYDQVMALQWIKKNAVHFNGDPDLITLFGVSAGAFSVSMHQISPLSKHLFKRAILQSGSAVNPLYSNENEQLAKICQDYAEALGCTRDGMTLERNPVEVVDCLKNLPSKDFAKVDRKLLKYKLLYPRIGNDFLPKNTIDDYRQGHFQRSEVLMGITRNEGTMFIPVFRPDLFAQKGVDISQIFNETSAYLFIKGFVVDDDPDMEDDVIHSYLEQVNKQSGYTYLTAVSEAIGDFLIVCGNIFQADYQSLWGDPVYFYMFDHRPSSSPYPDWMGVVHSAELQFVFGNPMFKHFTGFEEELSRDMINMWVTFAKTGNPSIPGEMAWPRYTYEDPKYYIIGKRDRVGVRPDHYRCDRWRNRFRSFIDDDVKRRLFKQHIRIIVEKQMQHP